MSLIFDYIYLFSCVITGAFIIYASIIGWLAFFTGNYKPIDKLRDGFRGK